MTNDATEETPAATPAVAEEAAPAVVEETKPTTTSAPAAPAGPRKDPPPKADKRVLDKAVAVLQAEIDKINEVRKASPSFIHPPTYPPIHIDSSTSFEPPRSPQPTHPPPHYKKEITGYDKEMEDLKKRIEVATAARSGEQDEVTKERAKRDTIKVGR